MSSVTKTLKPTTATKNQLSALDQILFGRDFAAQSPANAIAKIDYLKRVGLVQQYGRSTKKHQLFTQQQKLNILHNPIDMADLHARINELNIKNEQKVVPTSQVQITTDSFSTVHSVRIELDDSQLEQNKDNEEYRTNLAQQLGQQIVDAFESAQRKLFVYKKDQWIKEMGAEQQAQHPTISRLLKDDPMEKEYNDFAFKALLPSNLSDTPVVEKVLKQLDELNMKENELLKAARRRWLDEDEEEAQFALTSQQQTLKEDFTVGDELLKQGSLQVEHALSYMLPPLPYDSLLVKDMERAEREYDEKHGEGSYRRDAADKQRFYDIMDKTTMAQLLANFGKSSSLAAELSAQSVADETSTTEEAVAEESSSEEEEKNE